jgi:hypothetical protein
MSPTFAETALPELKLNKPDEGDLRMFEEARQVAKSPHPLPPAPAIDLPSRVDYSPYLTLVRNQDGYGGCGMMTSMALIDILKERERAYSPDLSYKFAGYVYNAAAVWPASFPSFQDPRVVVDPNVNQLTVLQEYGCCTEATFPTNYDPPNADPAGPPPPDQRPPDAAFAEAKLYRINKYSEFLRPGSAGDVKKWLYGDGDYPGGPVAALDLYLGHVVAIIGYDDNKIAQDGNMGGFLAVNSFGDQWGSNGVVFFSYQVFEALLQQQPTMVFRRVENAPTAASTHPFTARFKVLTTGGRRFLTARIGAEGQASAAVWNCPNQVTMKDDSLKLTLDAPLPAYASQCWPPSQLNRWFLEFTDTSPGAPSGESGIVQEVELVHRVMLPGGVCAPQVFTPCMGDIPVFRGHTVRIYIPTRASYLFDLAADHDQVAKGTPVTFRGSLSCELGLASTWKVDAPLSNRVVSLVRTEVDPETSDVLNESTVGTATTDTTGKYTVVSSATAVADYRAHVTRPDGTPIVNSNAVHIELTST